MRVKYLLLLLLFESLYACSAKPLEPSLTDETAEKMLLYQRANGGWPQYKGDATDYRLPISAELKEKLLADKNLLDATIDDRSTTLEINYLLEAFDKTKNKAYLDTAELGIRYLLQAQNPAGGWPQWYPDSTGYHIHITFNDNAMIDVMWIIKHLADDEGVYRAADQALKNRAKTALQNGIQCILRTQVLQHGQLTVWCAQHDSQTLQPASARKFEPSSLSGSESVGIVEFLMDIDNPSEAIKTAIRAAVRWFEQVQIPGWTVEYIKDPAQPSGKDRVIREDENSTIWARFYELETFRPIFTGRDAIIRYDLTEIENERRVGYAFYGKWPAKLLNKEYPAWEEKWK